MNTQNNCSLSCRPSIKLKLSPEEAQRFKIDAEFARQKVQEAKEAKDLEDAINTSSNENAPPADLMPSSNNDEINSLKWSHEAILLLIEEYRAREVDFTSGRISQKRLWEIISNKLVNEGHAVTGPQCMSKLNGLKRTYKSVKDHNGKSGNGTRAWTYFDVMDGFIGKKTYMAPVTTVSSTGKRSRTETETESENEYDSGRDTPKCQSSSQTVKKDIVSILQKSKQITEENRERRHKEKIEQRERSLALLEKIVATLKK